MASTFGSTEEKTRESRVLDTEYDRIKIPYATPQQSSRNPIRGTEI